MMSGLLASVAGQVVASGPTTVDVVSSEFSGKTLTASWSHTCTSGATALVVAIGTSNLSHGTFAVTYNGVSMTLLGETTVSGGLDLLWFVLFSPPTGASYTVVATTTTSSGRDFYGVGVSLFNCTFAGNFQGSSSASATSRTVSTASSATGLVLSWAAIFVAQTLTTPSGSTTLVTGTGVSRGTVCSQPGTGSSVTSAYSVSTAGEFSLAAIDVH